MRALVLHRYGQPPKLEDVAAPQPQPTDLLVEVHAASLNPVDAKTRDGKVKVLSPYKLPFVLGNELSGVVRATGGAVTRFRVGDEVYARLDNDRIGAFAELALVRESAAAKKPTKLGYVEAAALPLGTLTAWQALVDVAHVSAGQSVLIHAGSGGLGTLAVQLAKHLGARVITTAGARNEALLRSLGADQVIDYRAVRFEEALRDVDVVVDTQGGDVLERSFSVVKRGGIVVSLNGIPTAAFGRAAGLHPLAVFAMGLMTRKLTRLARRKGAGYEFVFVRADGAELEKITALVDAGAIRPVIDRAVPFDAVLDAMAYLETGRATGKVVVQLR